MVVPVPAQHVVAMRSNVKGYTYFPADTFTRYKLPVKE